MPGSFKWETEWEAAARLCGGVSRLECARKCTHASNCGPSTLTVLSSRYMVFDKKSIPIVAYRMVYNYDYCQTAYQMSYLICVIKTVVHESRDQ